MVYLEWREFIVAHHSEYATSCLHAQRLVLTLLKATLIHSNCKLWIIDKQWTCGAYSQGAVTCTHALGKFKQML